jgi:hypothetical protein
MDTVREPNWEPLDTIEVIAAEANGKFSTADCVILQTRSLCQQIANFS